MKVALAILFLAISTSAWAQSPFGPLPSSCGPKDTSFNVKLDRSQHSLTQPEPGKARVYFIHDSGAVKEIHTPTELMLGLDGAWAGANYERSYFSVSVDPGEHHICAATQSYGKTKLVVLAYFQAQAGRTYFYRTRLIVTGAPQYLELVPVDSDEARYLIASYPLSISHPRN